MNLEGEFKDFIRENIIAYNKYFIYNSPIEFTKNH